MFFTKILFITFFVLLILFIYIHNILPAIKNLRKLAFKKNFENEFNKVKIYRFGINDNHKDIKRAKKILNNIIKNGNDTDIAKSKMILNDIELQNNNLNVYKNLSGSPSRSDLYINPTDSLTRSVLHKNSEIKWFWPHLQPVKKINNEMVFNDNDIKIQEILLEQLKHKYPTNNLNVFDKVEIQSDKQNVHDHIVVRSIAQSLNNLTNISINDIENTNEFINFKNSLDDNTKLTLNKILSNIEKISSYNLSEYEIFVKVWNNIINHNNKNELLNILKLQLIDSYGMCSMGRANRIIQTLEGFDSNINIKPEWAILTEMNNKASKIFNDLLKNTLYTNIMESTDENLINNFKNEYKNLLSTEFNIYNNLLSVEYIDAKINEYLQVF